MASLTGDKVQRCQVKGCRRPRFLGGRCGYHALQNSPARAVAQFYPESSGARGEEAAAPAWPLRQLN
jgi:hypothetical protein